ncbi:divalent-cation tolerance protein CutA [Candidatus Dependentiae bacterium]|nr:divalent-cation tolerance protein CutA [Candidatus Dependentiae bacterium]
MTEYLKVITTIDSKEKAVDLCKKIVELRLVSCAQILGPIQSIYWWQDKVDNSEEYYCVFKTKSSLYPQLEDYIKKNHNYQVPEIIAVPIIFGSKEYLNWISNETV